MISEQNGQRCSCHKLRLSLLGKATTNAAINICRLQTKLPTFYMLPFSTILALFAIVNDRPIRARTNVRYILHK